MIAYVVQTVKSGKDIYAPEFLTWTTEAPTVEGWYWTKQDTQIIVVYVYPDKGYFLAPGLPNHCKLYGDEYWLGPIPQPEPPQ